jgi:hygromycin-B 7''-O-kinase
LSDNPLARLNTLDGYRRHFMDTALWEPFVRVVCQRHGHTAHTVRAGLAGTCPTFITDDAWVIKFFGRLFDGAAAFDTERRANQLVASDPLIFTPKLMASGQLFETPADWPWPYLIFEYLPGMSIGEVYENVSLDDKLTVARALGEFTRRLHQLPLGDYFPPTWEEYASFLRAQRAHCRAAHQNWGTLPPHLLDQIESFVLSPEALIDSHARPHLIHADLTADHVLGRLEHGHWATLGIIDFGDAMVGNLFYELVALHVDLFRCDKRLLAAYLDAYGLAPDERDGLPRKAMAAALLHRFNVLDTVFSLNHRAREVVSLDQLATLLWDIQVPSTQMQAD